MRVVDLDGRVVIEGDTPRKGLFAEFTRIASAGNAKARATGRSGRARPMQRFIEPARAARI